MPENTETRQFAVAQADKLIGQLAFRVSRTLKSRDSDSVHDLRVAIRRFAQAFTLLGSCFSAKDVKKIRRSLKEIRAQAGEVRDHDIALKLLLKSKLEEAKLLQPKIRQQRKEAERILLSTLKRWIERKSSLKWRTRLNAASAGGKKTLPDGVEEVAARILPRIAKGFFEGGKKASKDAGELHEFRIATKKFRYSLELFAPVYGSSLGPWLEQIKSVQALLGGINDCVTVRKMLSRWNSGESVDKELRKKERQHTEKFQRRWTKEFGAPGSARLWADYLSRRDRKQPLARKPVGRSASVARTEETVAAPAARRFTQSA